MMRLSWSNIPAGGKARLIAVLLVALLAPLVTSSFAQAQSSDPDPRLIRAADEGALAYVLTGDAEIDAASQAGLRGLTDTLAQRSTVRLGAPIGIDLDTDDLALMTFLYWPVTDTQPVPSPGAYARLNHFLRSGGMILFDTRDGDIAGLGGPDGTSALQALAAPLDIPPLAPVPADHVLTRTFYLLKDFPGRYQGNQIWAEAPASDAAAIEGVPFRNLNDGVSPVIIGPNAWAEAWAIDERGLPMFTVGTSFEGEAQREMAMRFGVNLIMYALTGNYKSDQVHVPALLERLKTEEGTP